MDFSSDHLWLVMDCLFRKPARPLLFPGMCRATGVTLPPKMIASLHRAEEHAPLCLFIWWIVDILSVSICTKVCRIRINIMHASLMNSKMFIYSFLSIKWRSLEFAGGSSGLPCIRCICDKCSGWWQGHEWMTIQHECQFHWVAAVDQRANFLLQTLSCCVSKMKNVKTPGSWEIFTKFGFSPI